MGWRSFSVLLVVVSFGFPASAQDDFGDDDFDGGGFGGQQLETDFLDRIDITRELTILREPHSDNEEKPNEPARPEIAVIAPGDETNSRVQKVLDRTGEFDFEGVSLTELVTWLRDQLEINVRLDRNSLAEESVEPDTENITIFAKEISYRAGLSQVLFPLGLVATVDRGVLTITTSTAAEETLASRIYPVADLVRSPLGPNFNEIGQLVKCISSIVAPDSWDAVGGPGTIAHYKDTLMVSNTPKVHRDIAGLF